MRITREDLPGSRVALTIEGDEGTYEQAIEVAWRRLASRVNIPGFRRGKAPRAVVMRMIGQEAVEEEALRQLLPDMYREALVQEDIRPVGDPEVDVVQRAPLVVKVTVSAYPKVALGSYPQIRLTREEPRVTEAQVDDRLERLRQQHAEWVPIERPAAKGDMVTLTVEGFTGHRPLLYSPEGSELLHADKGEVVMNEKDWAYLVEPEMDTPLPGFANQIVGMAPESDKEFRLVVPGDDARFEKSRLKGKEITFQVKAQDVKEKRLPEINDEFAKTVGNHDNLDGLRTEVRDMLLAQAKAEEEMRLSELVVDMVSAQVHLELPEVLVQREVERRMESLQQRLQRQNLPFASYLQIAEKSEDELRGEIRNQAERNLKSLLVVTGIADAESIQVTPEEVEEELLRLSLAIQDGERVRRDYADADRRSDLEARLRYDKTVRWLVENATQPEETPTEIATAADPSPSAEGDQT